MYDNTLIKGVTVLMAVAGAVALPRQGGEMKTKVRRADPPAALPENAPEGAIKFQPVVDYDKDSCYNVAAIDKDGNVAEGLETDGDLSAGCRDEADLNNQNVYSRTRCNNGWCAHMYEFYFEKDSSGRGGGHKHDWENIVVVVRDGEDHPAIVAASAHGGYSTKNWDEIQQQDSHPKIVYHKDGGSTHAFRFAKTNGGDEPPENHRGEWIRCPLVDYMGFPTAEIRQKLFDTWPSGDKPAPKTQDSVFAEYLDKAIGDRAEGFDTKTDG
ncbi:hypothetical protein FZEAL_5371 [Fusarium zealandicum]|uniref:Necrosis inducing protein (NPP1) n=1 Tax=Fusarium zealandicum TaxID=1053134 RepID=A0A8H4UKM1_9HYPO|nr:hypothetical protein FZEAL_5371 [Fusarium zealandicum]